MTRGVVLALALALAACGKSEPPAKTTLTFSVLSDESQQSGALAWAPFFKDMEAATGLKVQAFHAANYSGLVEALRFKQTDLGYFSNTSGLEAVRRADGEVFARTVNATGVPGYESIIVARKGSGITLDRLLECDRTLTFGMGDASSTSGTLAPMTYLFAPRGIEPARCFKVVRSASHDANLFAVANGVLDAATNNNFSFDRLALRGAGGATQSRLEVIWRSPRLPEDPLVWRKDLDPALKTKIADFVTRYGQGDTAKAAAERKVLAGIQVGAFAPADDRHLLPVREMEATEQLIEARRKGDKAAEAAAQSALDQVKREKGG